MVLKQTDEAMDGGAPLLRQRYKKSQFFYYILCDFFLQMMTVFHYKDLYEIDLNAVNNVDLKYYFGRDSKHFSQDKAFSYCLRIEKVIRQEFDKILDEIYPPIVEKTIIDAVFNQTEVEKKLKKKMHNNNK
jgi:hypothetical protein